MIPAIAIHLLVEAEAFYTNLATRFAKKSEFFLKHWEPNLSDFKLDILNTAAEVETWPAWKRGGFAP